MPNKPFLQGSECEYSMSVPAANGSLPRSRSRSRAACHQRLMAEIRCRHRWLPDLHNPHGSYLDNGSRLYLDTGGHNEASTPEVTTPREIAIYDRAAEQILLRARDAVRADGLEICLTKCNINFDFPDNATWGQHEAYTCWQPLENAGQQLLGYLASRSGFAGSGCLSANPRGMGLELSQRARHIKRAMGSETTSNRALFCTRAWKRSDVSDTGWVRTNLLSKDSQRCSFGMYLSHGVTGLLFMIINEGHRIGQAVQLEDPVAAMRAFSLDPWHQVTARLVNGKQATAVDIQREYLRQATPHVESGDYPEWTAELLEHWRTTLDLLEHDPLQLADRLDAYVKLAIMDQQLVRARVTWADLHRALRTLASMRKLANPTVIHAFLNQSDAGLDAEQRQRFRLLGEDLRLRNVGLDRLRFAVRLQALDLQYHELGGLFDRLERSGVVTPVVIDPAQVRHAIHSPPAGGRAAARSRWIRKLHGKPWSCDWEQVVSSNERRCIEMHDPFSGQGELAAWPRARRWWRSDDVPF